MKKLLLVLLIALLASCTTDKLTIKEPTLKNLKEYVLPPKFNTTPIVIKHKIQENINNDGINMPPPPPTHCALYPDDCQLWDTLVFNGANKINVVFVADGFIDIIDNDDYAGVSGYNKRVDSLIDGLFNYEPFTGNENEFNFFTYRTIPNSSPYTFGISTYSHPTNSEVEDIRITPWNVFKNFAGLPRYTHIPEDDRNRLYDSLIKAPNGYLKNKKVYAVILSAGEAFAGSGEFPKMYGNNQKLVVTIITKSTEHPFGGLMINLGVHEIAHAFDLDDEYPDSLYAANAPIYDPIVWNYPDRDNITRDTINDRKWNPLNYTDTGDKFWEGGRYLENGVFKSTAGLETCNCGYMMERIDRPFSELNKILIQERIDNH